MKHKGPSLMLGGGIVAGVIVLLFGAASVAGAEDTPGKPRPNVLFIMTDQQTASAISAAGNPWLKTPHMDSLAASGVRFAKSYCASPVCSPSRASLITGRMPHEHGVEVNGQIPHASIPNMGEVFRRAGYETVWTGKWHLRRSYLLGKKTRVRGFKYLPLPKGTKTSKGRDTDGPVADLAIEYLRRDHTRPFLLAVSLHNPHDVCHQVRRKPTAEPEPGRLPPLPANFEISPDEPEFIQRCRRRKYYGDEITATKNWDNRRWRTYLYDYYRLVEDVDRQIGRVLAALRDCGLEDNTLVVLTSDHGEGTAGHKWVVKLMFWEGPATVPLVVSWKGVTPAGAVDRAHPVSGVDILPTICDYAGVPPPKTTGTSLKPLIDDPDAPGREFVVAELMPDTKDRDFQGRMVRSKRYKYVAFSTGRRPEMLFDMDADPGEMKNLAYDPAEKKVLVRHRKLLREWIAKTKDDFQLPQRHEGHKGNPKPETRMTKE